MGSRGHTIPALYIDKGHISACLCFPQKPFYTFLDPLSYQGHTPITMALC